MPGFSTRAIKAASRVPTAPQPPVNVPIYQTSTFEVSQRRGAGGAARILAAGALVQPLLEPDPRRAGGCAGRAGGCRGLPRHRLGHGRHPRASCSRSCRWRRGDHSAGGLRRRGGPGPGRCSPSRVSASRRSTPPTPTRSRRRSTIGRACSGSRRSATRPPPWPTSRHQRAGPRSGVRLAVDNTFASPYLANPLALGADAGGAFDHQVRRRPFGPDRRRGAGQRRAGRRRAEHRDQCGRQRGAA